jgi:predicted nuclease with RNAse H fold
MEPVVVGVDLASVETRPTGLCLLRGWRAETSLVYGDAELLAEIQRAEPAVVMVDAPLSLPPGRQTIYDRNGAHLRPCDEELRRRGVKFFPITLGPMRRLTERGLRIKAALESAGLWVFETYPGGAQDVWGIPRKQRGLEGLRAGLEALGVIGLRAGLSDHELDAVTAALVGQFYLEGQAEMLGPPEGILLPLPIRSSLPRAGAWQRPSRRSHHPDRGNLAD